MSYDVVIVGAGLAGLRCGLFLQKKGYSTCILEKYNYVGGRVVTYRNKQEGVQWENGAGRFHNTHYEVHNLIRTYGLTAIPISAEQNFIPNGRTEADMEPNTFELQMAIYLNQIKNLSPTILQNHTLEEILKSILGESKTNAFLQQFPYRAEITILRADHAIKQFMSGGEMGTYDGYSVCKEGLSGIVGGMSAEYESLGGEILVKHEMLRISQNQSTVQVLCIDSSNTTNSELIKIEGKKCILALHSSALLECRDTSHFPVLRCLQMAPLLRTYAVFPTKKKKSWFSDLPRIVCGSPVRYFIPIDAKHGVAMVSYTDADDAQYLINLLRSNGEDALGAFILEELRSLFPDRDIPEYDFFKAHPWYDGCTYWKPGTYDVEKMSKDCMRPDPHGLPSVYLCGESFSTRQAWMEGALEHADQLLQRYFVSPLNK